MNTPASSSNASSKTDWTALASCSLATFIFLGVSFIFGWLVAGQDQIFRFSDAVKRTIGLDFLWLAAIILLVGTPTVLLLSAVAFYRTRKSRGRKGRSFALFGLVLCISVIAFIVYLASQYKPLPSNFSF